MLQSSYKPFEERQICFWLAFICVQACGFSGCSGFGFFPLFGGFCFGFVMMISVFPELDVSGKGEGLVGSQFSAFVPSHTDLQYEQS